MSDNKPSILHKPTTTTRTNKTLELTMKMNQEQHSKILFQFLRQWFPNFEGFDLDEIEMIFREDGNVIFHASKGSPIMPDFDPKVKEITTGDINSLSISLDYDTDPTQSYPILLFIPYKPHHDHWHIELTKEQSISLRNWLNDYLKEKI